MKINAGFLPPRKISPDILVMESVQKWNKSTNTALRELATRVMCFVVIPFMLVVSCVINATAFVLKLPVTLIRVTIGMIKKDGVRLADSFPEGTQMITLLWHAYKALFVVIEIFSYMTLGLVHPRALVCVHIKMKLLFPLPIQTKSSIPLPPPPPPPDWKAKIKASTPDDPPSPPTPPPGRKVPLKPNTPPPKPPPMPLKNLTPQPSPSPQRRYSGTEKDEIKQRGLRIRTNRALSCLDLRIPLAKKDPSITPSEVAIILQKKMGNLLPEIDGSKRNTRRQSISNIEFTKPEQNKHKRNLSSPSSLVLYRIEVSKPNVVAPVEQPVASAPPKKELSPNSFLKPKDAAAAFKAITSRRRHKTKKRPKAQKSEEEKQAEERRKAAFQINKKDFAEKFKAIQT